jgi:hypothetical protein
MMTTLQLIRRRREGQPLPFVRPLAWTGALLLAAGLARLFAG